VDKKEREKDKSTAGISPADYGWQELINLPSACPQEIHTKCFLFPG
jgi:hypothetical protein